MQVSNDILCHIFTFIHFAELEDLFNTLYTPEHLRSFSRNLIAKSRTIECIVPGKSDIEYRVDGILHNTEGPAIIRQHSRLWYYNGQLHNPNGPAECQVGADCWYKHGKKHRLDGPAYMWYAGTEWWVDGVLHNTKGPARYKIHYTTYTKRSNFRPPNIAKPRIRYEIFGADCRDGVRNGNKKYIERQPGSSINWQGEYWIHGVQVEPF